MRLYTFAPENPFDAFDDRLFWPLGRADESPAYDVARNGEDRYHVAIAVPGYAEGELDVAQQANELVVTAKPKQDPEGLNYLRRAINTRGFESRFQLGENVRVGGATLANGVLGVDLVREVPEALKPRRIAIGAEPAIEGKKAA